MWKVDHGGTSEYQASVPRKKIRSRWRADALRARFIQGYYLHASRIELNLLAWGVMSAAGAGFSGGASRTGTPSA